LLPAIDTHTVSVVRQHVDVVAHLVIDACTPGLLRAMNAVTGHRFCAAYAEGPEKLFQRLLQVLNWSTQPSEVVELAITNCGPR
jgi:hypothetical protein